MNTLGLTEEHFKPQESDWHLGFWDKNYCTHIRAVRSNKKPTQLEDTLIPTSSPSSLCGAGHSSRAEIEDVEEYHRQLKSDLGTGQEGFPADCLLVADRPAGACHCKEAKEAWQ